MASLAATRKIPTLGKIARFALGICQGKFFLGGQMDKSVDSIVFIVGGSHCQELFPLG